MSHEREKPVEPFADLHCEEGHVRATLLHDPTVEGLDVALYLDGSGSMRDEYENKTKRSFWEAIMGRPGTLQPNQVEPQARWMLQYLATKDRNGLLRVGYWATGSGRELEIIGEVAGMDAAKMAFPGPQNPGDGTHLAPALRDYVDYLKRQVKTGARRGCAVFITDGQLHDAEAVKDYSGQVARMINHGQLPRTNFILVGVGDQVNEEQLEDVCHEEYAGIGHLWCHRIAAEITQMAELVAVLVDETMTVSAGGTVYDDKGRVVKVYEGRLPAVLEFEVPEGTESFTLEVAGQRYTQPLPEDDDHHE